MPIKKINLIVKVTYIQKNSKQEEIDLIYINTEVTLYCCVTHTKYGTYQLYILIDPFDTIVN